MALRVLLATAAALLALSSIAFAGESCTSEPDSDPGSHPGVVLGPATKCVRDDGGTTTSGQVPAASERPRDGSSVGWATLAAAGSGLAAFVYASALIRKRMRLRAQPESRAA